MKRLVVVAILMTGGLVGNIFCQAAAKPAPPASIVGSVEEGKYTNQHFGFSLSFPKGWIVADQEVTSTAKAVGSDIVAGTDEKKNKAIKDSMAKEVVLLNLMKKPLGAFGNAMFMMVATRQASPKVTPSMVAEATKSVFSSSPALKLTGDTQVKTIVGRQFALLDYEITVNERTVKSKFHVTMVGTYALTFSLSYTEDEDLAELQKIVDSIRFVKQ